jgi:CDP-glucose 4,6-dehydratase
VTDFFRHKRVLLTGHTGFKGSWLALWLHRLGARVSGLALDPATTPSLFDLASVGSRLAADHRVDLRDREAVARVVELEAPEIVFHLAAQPIVKTSYAQPLETFATNVMGTLHVLDALRRAGRAAIVVVVTTDKVYANAERGEAFVEDAPLGGHDPYSASKACTEIATASFRASFAAGAQLRIATARAGNVIGGGDWSEHRLVPDIARAFARGEPVRLRNPRSTRPWQHVVEPLAGYLCLAERLAGSEHARFETAFNLGPQLSSVQDVETVARIAAAAWDAHGISSARIEVTHDPSAVHEAATLSLAIDKSRHHLGWEPRWELQAAVQRTVDWYARHHRGIDAASLVTSDIERYETDRSAA